MGTISLSQLFLLSLVLVLVFGDVSSIIKKFKSKDKNYELKNKNRKKGS